jgi:hypothetical protein
LVGFLILQGTVLSLCAQIFWAWWSVVESPYFAGLRVFVVVFLWTKRGELRGKRGAEAVTFCGG